MMEVMESWYIQHLCREANNLFSNKPLELATPKRDTNLREQAVKEAREVFLRMKMITFSADLWRAIRNSGSGSGSLSIVRNCGTNHTQQEFRRRMVNG